MSGVNEFLDRAYGTTQPLPSSEETEKVAQAQMFAKLAADSGIDLNQLEDGQIADLWNTFVAKTAAEGGHGHKHGHKKEESEEEKKAAAAIQSFELAKQAEAEEQQKLAEADWAGRVMAHAYVDELKKIAASGGGGVGGALREAGEAVVGAGRRAGELLSGSRARRFGEAAEHHKSQAQKAKGFAEKLTSEKGKELAKKIQGKHTEAVGEFTRAHGGEKSKVLAARLGAGGAAAAGVGAAALAHKKEKKGSAELDEFAAQLAVEKVAAAGGDPEVATERLVAFFTLNPMGSFDDDSSKIASAETVEQGVEIRALELLEAVGYDVTWG